MKLRNWWSRVTESRASKTLRVYDALAEHGEMYGFQLMEACNLSSGSLYVSLARLRDLGMIEWRRSGRRTFYRLVGRFQEMSERVDISEADEFPYDRENPGRPRITEEPEGPMLRLPRRMFKATD